MTHPIPVPLDGSAFSERVLPIAQAIVTASNADLILCHVHVLIV